MNQQLDISDRTAVTRAPVALQGGTVIAGRYRIEGKIAAGGMGEVYRVEHVELGRTFAMKVMKRELSNDQQFVDRFRREAIASSRIGQQNIVDITDFGRTEDGRFYFVMEYLDGETLAELVRREGPVSPRKVLHLTAQMCAALGAAHRVGVVHRDLKPDNVMVLKRARQASLVKVVDFGIAKVRQQGGGDQHTFIGMVVGTPQYMSPEQAAGLQVDARSDIYSLGLVVYELLAGQPAFKGESASVLMAMHMTEPAPQLPKLPEPVPGALEDVLFKMLAKRPEDRPQSMEEVLEALESLKPHTGFTPAVTRVAPRSLQVSVTMAPAPAAVTLAPLPALTPIPPRVKTPAPKTVKTPPPQVAETGPVQLPRGARNNGFLLLMGFLAFAATTAVGVVALLSHGDAAAPVPVTEMIVVPPPSTPEPVAVAAAVVPVKLSLKTAPAAEVYEGDVFMGTTPMALVRPTGTTLELRFVAKGYAAELRKVAFDEDRELSVTLEAVERPAPQAKPAADKVLVKRPTSSKPKAPKPGDLKDLPF
jgi:hypothetical protein